MKWQPAKKDSLLHRARAHKIVSFIIFIIIIICGLLIYEKIALEINKRNFQHARTTIDKIYADIVAQVGQPDNFKRTNSCSRPNQTFTEGPLSCGVSSSMVYRISGKDRATNKFKLIQNIVSSNKLFILTTPASSAIESVQVGVIVSSTALDHYTLPNTRMECSIKYVFDTPSETDLTITNQKDWKSFYITIGCDDWARAEFYPIS